MSNPRLIIDTGIIDGTESGTSTIAGTIFGFGDRGVGLEISESPTELRIPFRVRVQGDDNATMLDRVQDVLDLLDAANVEGLVIEMQSGVEVVDIARDTVKNIRYETTRKPGDNGMVIEGNFIIEKFDPDYTEGRATWQYQRNGSGRGFVVGRIFAESRAAAVAYTAPIRAGSSRPVWMASSFRVQEDTTEFEFQGGVITGADGLYAPGEAVVVFEQMPAWAAANSVFNDVVKMELTFNATQREELDVRAGNVPGLDVDISGRLTFKTESSTTFDAADTTTTSSTALPTKVEACLTAIIAEAQKRLGEGVLTPMARLDRSVTGEDGVYQFAIPLITEGPSRVLKWTEVETYTRETRDVLLDIYDGSDWEMEHPGGFRETINHVLTIEALGGSRGYTQPRMFGRGKGTWKLMRDADRAPEIKRRGNGRTGPDPQWRFVTHFERDYLLRKGKASGGSGPVITQEGTGSGLTA